MIELRWVKQEDDHSSVPVLQYRQQIDTTVRAGIWSNEDTLRTANYQWSEWCDVLTTVIEDRE